MVQQQNPGKLGIWRFLLWTALGAALLCPLVAMRFTDEVRWDLADLLAAVALLVSLGAAVELAFLSARRTRTRVMLIGASVLAFMLVWANAAVGIF